MRIPLKDQDFAKTKFIDTLDYSDLSFFTILGKISPQEIQGGDNIFLQSKVESFVRFVKVISINEFNITFLDRLHFYKKYQETSSFSQALADSVFSTNLVDIQGFGKLDKISHADLMKKFKTFNKELQATLKERASFTKENPQNFYYEIISSKSQLNDSQIKKREDLSILNKTNSYEFKDQWNKATYHLQTLIYRSYHTRLQIGKKLSQSLGNLEESQDFGLTDPEIISGLQSAHKFLELYLYKAFIQGNKHLPVMIDLYSNHKKNDNLKILFRNIVNDELSEEEISFLDEHHI